MSDTAKEIASRVDWLERQIADAEGRLKKAMERGTEFASAVYRYVESPQEVGRQSLRDAYSKFMSAHAGNFGPGS